MGMFDWFTGASDKEQARPAPQQAGPSAEGSNQASQGRSGGVLGWFQSAGSWVADRWNDTTEAVGGFVQRAGEVVKDTVDVVRSTSLTYEDGRVGIETDLDEVMDLMPESVREKLQLDRNGAANRMRLEVDTQRGGLTLSSDDLAVAGVRAGGLQTGAVRLKDVRIDLSNPGAGLPFVDVPFIGGEEGPDNPSAAVSVGSVEAENIQYQGASGPVSLRRLSAGNLSAHASAREGMPFGGGKDTTAGFSVENAVVDGLAMNGVAVDHAQAERASAGLFGQSETAFLETEGLVVNGVRQGDRSLGDASIGHARVDVRNQGGGLPMLDDQADHMSAEVVVSAANVHDLRAGDQGVGEATLAQFRALYDQDQGTARANAEGLNVAGVDTAGVDVARAGLDRVELDATLGADRNRVAVRAGVATASGVVVTPTQASNRAESATKPLDWSVGLDRAEVADLNAMGNRVQNAMVGGVDMSGSVDARGLSARGGVERASVVGLDTALMDAGSLGVQGVRVETGDGRTNLTAASATGERLDGANFAAGHVDARGASLSMGPDATSVGLEHAGMRDARVAGRLSLQSASVDDLSARITEGERRVGVGAASVTGARDSVTGARVGQADLAALEVANLANRTDASLGSLAVRDAGLGQQAHLDRGQVSGITASLAGDQVRAGFRSADASGIRANANGTDAVVQHIAATDGALRRDNGATHVTLETGAVTGARYGEFSVGQVATHGATVDLDGRGTSLGATGVQVDDFASRNFSAGQLNATNTAVRLQGEDVSASLDHARVARANVGGRLSIGEATAENLDASVVDGRRSVTLDAAHVANLADAPTGTRVSEADLAGLRVANQGETTDAALASLGARGVSSGQHSVARVDATGATAHIGADGQRGGLDALRLENARSGASSVASVNVAGLRGSQQNGEISAGFTRADANQLHLSAAGTTADVGTVSARDASLSQGRRGTDASLGQLSASDMAVQVAGSTGRTAGASTGPGLPIDTASLIRTATARVDDASLRASVPLRAGDLPGAPVSVRDNTVATANVGIRDNRITQDTRVSLSRGLDAPLWVDVNGAYVDDQNRLRADLSGFKDINATSNVNEALGLQGDRLHSLGTMGDAAARRLGQTPTAPANPGQGSAMDAVDLANLRADATVGFSAGTIDAGRAGQVTLANGTQAGDNTVHGSVDRDRVLVDFTRILTGSFRADTGTQAVQGGPATLTGADVSVNRQSGAVQGNLDALEASQLRYHGAPTAPVQDTQRRRPNS